MKGHGVVVIRKNLSNPSSPPWAKAGNLMSPSQKNLALVEMVWGKMSPIDLEQPLHMVDRQAVV